MGAEGDKKAPTVVIDTVLLVRPIKVVGLMCGIIAVFLLTLSVAATAWLTANGEREGLWERCIYESSNTLNCTLGLKRDLEWIDGCKSLCVISMIVTIIAIIVTAQALKNVNFRVKYKLYWAGLVLFFIACAFELISLIIFPIKFLDEMTNRDEAHWNFGWAYVLGWCAAVGDFGAGLFLLLDRDAEEIVYRERVVQEEAKNGIEASEDV